MTQELSDKVWGNPAFHDAALKLERAWQCREIGAVFDETISIDEYKKLIRSAAILACSANQEHRRGAFRVATCIYDLAGSEEFSFAGPLRVVLTRIGNFPSLETRVDVKESQNDLPFALVTEEMRASDARKVIAHRDILFLTDFQHQLWGDLVSGKRVALAAPTSAGKSFVLEHFLSAIFASKIHLIVLYLVPTRALIAQVAADLGEQFRDFDKNAPDIITIPLETDAVLPARAIYVMTQERAQLMLNGHPEFAADVIVTDEAHSIADGSRGVLLQWVIDDLLERKASAQILFASPGIRNLDVFARLFGLPDLRNLASVEPTVLQNFFVVRIENATRGRISIHSANEGEKDLYKLSEFDLGHSIASKIEKLVHISVALGENKSNIIYANGADEAEKISLQLADLRVEHEPTEVQISLADLAVESVHASYVLAECVKRGVGFHYSNMPTQLRRAIEAAAMAGDIEYLVCTSTLLQGVNLPAKNIFLCMPEKGRTNPLQSTDFWNLSGRAGRLRKEFQGNIFLIDYENWKSKPLDGPKDAVVTPAIEISLRQREPQLISIITDESSGSATEESVLETVFVKLYSEYKVGKLENALQRSGVDRTSAAAIDIMNALDDAETKITLPRDVLRRSPDISAHKQQRLLERIDVSVAKGEMEAQKLIPKHPRESDAFTSYADILQMCHEIILGINPFGNLHRFRAVMAQKWMLGLPLPQIIDEQIRRNAKTNSRTTIRKTLEVIETQIRFQTVRLFGCYNSILTHALLKAELTELVPGIPALPVYLEVGASDRTMISFISLGLSRVTAMKLNELSARKDLDVSSALNWLKTRPLDTLGLSPLLLREVSDILAEQ